MNGLKWLRQGFGACVLGMAALSAHGQEPALPPVDQVFVPSANAPARDRIEVRWNIAPGFYLYRHRLGVQALGGFAARELKLPTGRKAHDEFFGDVETYRGSVTATLPGTAAPGSERVSLRIRYQGCAEAGVCYPPQTRTLSVALPGGAAASAGSAAPAADAGFAALGRSLGGAPAAGSVVPGTANAAPLPEAEAYRAEVIADGPDRLLLRLLPARGYYVYRNSIHVKATAPAGVTAAAPGLPAGTPHRDEHFGTVPVYFNEITAPVPLQRTAGGPVTARVRLEFQGCQDNGICYPPMRRSFSVGLPKSAGSPTAAAPPTEAASTSPTTGAPHGTASAAGGTAALAPPDAATTASIPAATPATHEPAEENAPPGATAAAVPGVPAPHIAPDTRLQTTRVHSVWLAIALALLGGLLLNLMPCVLPVLSLKALTVLQGGAPRRMRRHALGYGGGILVAMAALWLLARAIGSGGAGWGSWMQSPLMVALLGLVVFALGLGLSGLWALPGFAPRSLSDASQRDSALGDALTGVLAVLVAAPCTGPFMASALAYATGAPALAGLAVFLALGLGLALPLIAIAWLPALARRMPKPGAWMETLRQVLAFPLYLSAAWLAWVAAQLRGPDAAGLWMVAAVGLAFACWVWHRRSSGARLWPALGMLAGLALGGVALARLHGLPPRAQGTFVEASALQQPWSQARLARLRAQGAPVLVNMTADWCITCKVNERAVFARPAFAALLKETGTHYLVGDFTGQDPSIAAYLDAHQAVGVPLYMLYPAGGRAPIPLPSLLTPALIEARLREAAR